MKIFLSYASQDRGLAEEIQLALLGSGHSVFFDKASLPAGGDYHSRIESAVRDSDIFVFLISSNSTMKGSYALTELKFARDKWPHPMHRVVPVRLHRTPWDDVPPYLKSVTILEPEGNAAAEVVAAVKALRLPASPEAPLPDKPKQRIWWQTKPVIATAIVVVLSAMIGTILVPKRISLKGTWTGSPDCKLVFYKDDGKSVEGSCDNPSVSHRVTGKYDDSTNIEITITRIDQDKCETKVSGYIKIKNNDTLEIGQAKWSGCGVNSESVSSELKRS